MTKWDSINQSLLYCSKAHEWTLREEERMRKDEGGEGGEDEGGANPLEWDER